MSDDWIKKMDEAHAKMVAKDSQAKVRGTLLGRYINEPYADGYALYEIVKVNTKTVRIKWLDIYDGWTIPYWGKEATIDRAYAEKNLGYRDALADIFGKE